MSYISWFKPGTYTTTAYHPLWKAAHCSVQIEHSEPELGNGGRDGVNQTIFGAGGLYLCC